MNLRDSNNYTDEVLKKKRKEIKLNPTHRAALRANADVLGSPTQQADFVTQDRTSAERGLAQPHSQVRLKQEVYKSLR